ncbi:hypothetical protein K7887_22350 (plasmid) [Sutcliffiella horikoshii]|uniref:hypothetical protein n=1 Tax=Sutcliffiella horikoshii TaxID=79883 RepID=UPI001CBAF45F|nr:hypothetical protein [Sutcliffiella horikoshii]UAL49861.1 hypothetical protein K7887_22350 [Sutcliffiella horikoshii]
MLKLVVNNPKKKIQTCQTDCMMYDGLTDQCGYWKNIEVAKPSVFLSCEKKVLSKSTNESLDYSWSKHMQHASYSNVINDEGYPFQPVRKVDRSDAFWYVSPDQTFGCWVIDKSTKKIIALNKTIESTRQYSSPVPLHDHGAAGPIASVMCWYVNQDGIGKYAMLKDSKLINLG